MNRSRVSSSSFNGWLPTGLGLLLGLGCAACASLHSREVLVPPERNALPEYPGRTAQHQVLTLLWRVALMEPDAEPVDRHHHGQVAASRNGRRLYVGSYNGVFACIDALTGKLIWRKLAKGPFDSSPTVNDGVVYASSGGGVLYAWRETDGALLWSYEAGAPLDGRPVVTGDRVLVNSAVNTLFCLDAMTGKWRWSYRRDVPSGRFQVKGVSDPLVVDDSVYVGFSDGYLAKLALKDGSVQALKNLSGKDDRFTDVDGDPLLVDSKQLLAASFSRGVVAMDPEELRELWSHKVTGASTVVGKEQMIYYSTADSKVEALRLESGGTKPVWRFRARAGALSQPVVTGDWLLVSSSEQSLLVLDRNDGKVLQVFNPGKGSGSVPTVLGNRVYWLSNGQTLYCLGLSR